MSEKSKQANRRVLFVFYGLGIGGAQKIQAFVANLLLDKGYSVCAISFVNDDIGVDLNPDIKIDYLSFDREKNKTSKLYQLSFLYKLRKAIIKSEAQAVCVFKADMARIVVLATCGLNIPIIASERGDPGQYLQLNKYNRALKRCEKVVFQTQKARAFYRINDEKTEIIPNPCIPRWESNNYSYRENVIVGAGRLCRQKRFDILIDAFKEVHKKYPEFKLEIYGSGELEEELQKHIEINNLKACVSLCGYTKDVFTTAGIPSLFVLSSDYEGIPNVLMEAMMLGIPCVSTDCEPGGAALLFNNGERGLLSPVGDSKALSENIIGLIENAEIAKEYGEKGKEIISEFSPNVIGEKWVELFNGIKYR